MESIIDILHKGGYSCVMKNRDVLVRAPIRHGEIAVGDDNVVYLSVPSYVFHCTMSSFWYSSSEN